MTTPQLAHLIDSHIYLESTPAPLTPSLEVRRHAWRAEAQARLNAVLGLRAQR